MSISDLGRRGFLKVGCLAGGALTVNWCLPSLAQGAQTNDQDIAQKPHEEPGMFIKLLPGNKLEVVTNRLEFGQGVTTAFAMIVCEELDFPIEDVSGALGGNHPAYNDPIIGVHMTGGSASMSNSYSQYRKLGVALRQMLREAAAEKWKVPLESVQTKKGFLISGKNKESYFALAKDASGRMIPADISLKSSKKFEYIGKPVRRIDAESINKGTKIFGIDLILENMSTAVIVRPPTFTGGKVKSFMDEKAKAVKGVKAVFKVPLDRGSEGIAIVADSYWAAKTGRDALSVEWVAGASVGLNSDELFKDFIEKAKKPEVVALDWTSSKAAEALEKYSEKPSYKKVVFEYKFPYLAHASMEPLNCTVQVTKENCTVWSGSQMPGIDTFAVSKIVGLPPEKITLNVLPAGGGFGRRATPTSDVVSDATSVAKGWFEMGQKGPVKTIWSREDDMRGGYYRPMHVHRAEIVFDEKGNVVAWDHTIVGQSIVSGSPFEAMMVKNGVDSTMVKGIIDNYYGIAMRLRITHPKLAVPVLWWRSVEHTHTAYVMETLADEMARQAKLDPVDFRLKNLTSNQSRLRAALELAVQESGYRKKKLAKGHAWGVAVHESFNTAVAYVVEASLQDGKPVIHNVTAGVHCNTVVNPLTAKTQVEGGMIYGFGTTLPGSAITLKDGEVVQGQYTDFTVPRISDVPKNVQIHFVPSDAPPTGLGEPGLPPFIPALANAMAKITGKIPTNLPFEFS